MSYSTNTKWSIDATSSKVSFVVNHLMISTVKGCFKNFNASVYTEDKDFTTAKIDFWLDPSTIDTHDRKRDDHLIGSEFFDVDNYPMISFVSDLFKKIDMGNYELQGNLTIKEVTRCVKLIAKFIGYSKNKDGCDLAKFLITGSLNRKHWKLDWNIAVHANSIFVSDEVLINCEIELLREEEILNKETALKLELEQSVAPEFVLSR